MDKKDNPMSWIEVIDVPEAEGALREAYDEVDSARGEVANILKAHTLHLTVLIVHLHCYREFMFGRFDLSRAEPRLSRPAAMSQKQTSNLVICSSASFVSHECFNNCRRKVSDFPARGFL